MPDTNIHDALRTTNEPITNGEAMAKFTQNPMYRNPNYWPYKPYTETPPSFPEPTPITQQAKSATRTKRKRRVQSSRKVGADPRQHCRPRLMEDVDETRPLACPFAKHDPINAPGCWEFAADNLARLKYTHRLLTARTCS